MCNPSPYITVRAARSAGTVAKEVEMKRMIALLMLLVAAATLAMVGPGTAEAVLADNGVINSRN